MTTKYGNLDIPDSSVANECKRLTNQIWKLIPMRENQEQWEAQAATITEEIAGLGQLLIIAEDPNFLILLSKLEGLTTKGGEDFMIYRKTVFRCIDLLNKVLNNE